jgi:hypothetical protein
VGEGVGWLGFFVGGYIGRQGMDDGTMDDVRMEGRTLGGVFIEL